MTVPPAATTLGAFPEKTIARAAAFALDVSGAKAGPVPEIDFAALVPRVRDTLGKDRLARADPADAEEALNRLAGVPALSVAELRRDGVSTLTRPVERIAAERYRGPQRDVNLLLARAAAWACEFWAVEGVSDTGTVLAVSDVVVPVWTVRAESTIGGAAGIGTGITRRGVRASGRREGLAESLRAQGRCRVWVTADEWVLARSPIAPTDAGLPVIFDRLPRAQVVTVRNVWPRMTIARQLEIRFDDGSRARFVYATRGNTLELLADACGPVEEHPSEAGPDE